jgi:hypothetical protein
MQKTVIIIIALIALFATGCALSVPVSGPSEPTITLAGEAGIREMANNAYALNATVTAEFQRILSTQASATQSAIIAQQQAIVATQVAEGATATSIYQRAQATQIAAQWQATQTMQAVTVANAVNASEAAGISLTQESYAAQKALYELEAFKQEIASRTTFNGMLTLVIITSIASLAYVVTTLIHRACTIAINRHAVVIACGVAVTEHAGDLVYLPTYSPPMLEEEVSEIEHTIVEPERCRIRQQDGNYITAIEALKNAEVKRQRTAWMSAALRFMRIGANIGSYSQRKMAEAGIGRADWETMTNWLAQCGFLEKDRAGWWQRAVWEDGEALSMRDIVSASFWSTEFVPPYPIAPSLPDITENACTTQHNTHVQARVDTPTHSVTPHNRYGAMKPPGGYDDEINRYQQE